MSTKASLAVTPEIRYPPATTALAGVRQDVWRTGSRNIEQKSVDPSLRIAGMTAKLIFHLAWPVAVAILLSSIALAAPQKKKKSSWLQNVGKALDSGSSRSATTVAGVRGLDEPGGPINTEARDYTAIDRLEKVQVTPEELRKFLAEGKLP